MASLLQLSTQLFATVFLFRFYLRFCQVGGKAPIANAVAKITNPVTRLVGLIVPSVRRFDVPALVIAGLILWLQIGYLYEAQGVAWNWLYMGKFVVIKSIKIMLDIIFFSVLIRVIMSWLRPNDHSDFALQIIYPCSDWILQPVQRIIPPLGMFDLSPIIVLVGLQVFESLVVGSLS